MLAVASVYSNGKILHAWPTGEAQHKNRVKPLMPRTPRHHATFLGDMFTVMLVSLRLSWLMQVYGLGEPVKLVDGKNRVDNNRVARSFYHAIGINTMSVGEAVRSLSNVLVMTSGRLPLGYNRALFKEEVLKLGLISMRGFRSSKADDMLAKSVNGCFKPSSPLLLRLLACGVKLAFFKTLKIKGVFVRSMPSYCGAPWVDWIIVDLAPAAASSSVVPPPSDAHWYACQVHTLFAMDLPGAARSFYLLVSKYVGADELGRGTNLSLPRSRHLFTGLPLIKRLDTIVVASTQVVGGLWVVDDPDKVDTLKWVLTNRRFTNHQYSI